MEETTPKQTNVQFEVRTLLENKPFVRDLLAEGIVNYSALARKLRFEIPGATLDSIVMAIRRYSEKLEEPGFLEKFPKGVSKFEVRVKNNVVEVTLEQSPEVYEKLIEAQEKINWVAGESMNIVQSTGEIAVAIDENIYHLLDDLKYKKIHEEKGLSRITVTTPKEFIDIPGMIYYFTGVLARNGVNLIDCTSTFTRMIFLVREKDASQAFELLNKAIKPTKR